MLEKKRPADAVEQQQKLLAEAREVRLWAFIVVSVSIATMFLCMFFVPWICCYLQRTQTDLQAQIDICKDASRQLAAEVRSLLPRHGTALEVRSRQTRTLRGSWNQLSYKPPASAQPASRNCDFMYEFFNCIRSECLRKLDMCCTCQQGPVGPPGMPGTDGNDGRDGENGRNGRPGKAAPPHMWKNMNSSLNCVICPEAPGGVVGPPGRKGHKGPRGRFGHPGKSYFFGAVGIAGPPGTRGSVGKPGRKGPPGDPGVVVLLAGPCGQPGWPGPPGRTGITGPRGQGGRPGRRGPLGMPGDRGSRGRPGRRGICGPPGLPGQMGVPGSCVHCPVPRTVAGY